QGRYEALAGRHRVRDVEDPPPGATVLRESFARADDIREPSVRELATRVLRSGLLEEVTADADEPIVVEFNVQKRPVGRLRDTILLWEWRPAAAPPRPQAPSAGEADAAIFGGKGAGPLRTAAAGLPAPPAAALPAAPPAAAGGV